MDGYHRTLFIQHLYHCKHLTHRNRIAAFPQLQRGFLILQPNEEQQMGGI